MEKWERGNQKKSAQLGMNASTASQRLVKDLLFSLAVQAGNRCFHCGGELDRETFSIEHKTPWLDSADPVGLFFDLSNVGFSHHACNVGAGRRPTKRFATREEARRDWERRNRRYDPEKRKAQYQRTGN